MTQSESLETNPKTARPALREFLAVAKTGSGRENNGKNSGPTKHGGSGTRERELTNWPTPHGGKQAKLQI
jgi:hypothetical protein